MGFRLQKSRIFYWGIATDNRFLDTDWQIFKTLKHFASKFSQIVSGKAFLVQIDKSIW